MRLLLAVLTTVVAVAHSSHRRYRSPDAVYHPHAETLRHTPISYTPCRKGLAPRSDGKCVPPKVSKDVYFFNAPHFEAPHSPPLYEPRPKVHYNYVFVKTADKHGGNRPLIVPPPKQKTVVYLLSENQNKGNQEVIEVPFYPTQPEVHFVGYQDGDNPSLPGGIDLQTALAHAGPGLGPQFGEHGNVGHGGNSIESGNGLDGFGSIHHGSGDLHGLSGHHEISAHHGVSDHHELSGQYGLSGQHGLGGHHGVRGLRGASDLHGLSHHNGVFDDYEIVGPEGITELSGVHYKDGSPFSREFGEDFGGRLDDRFHRDVRERHSTGRDQGPTRSSGTSSSATSRGTSLGGNPRKSTSSGILRGSSSSGISRGAGSRRITRGGTSRVTSSTGTSRGVSSTGTSRGRSPRVTSRANQSTRFVPSPRVEYN